MKLISILLVLAVGCAGVPKPDPVVPERKRAEDRPMPTDPSEEALPDGLGPDFPPEPVEIGSCLPEGSAPPPAGVERPCPAQAGILISEPTAAKARLYQIRYAELRKTYEADRIEWRAHRELYEVKLDLAHKEIVELQPTWYEENDATFALIGGLVLGGVISIGIAAGLDEAQK
jgi:hypothetical protein